MPEHDDTLHGKRYIMVECDRTGTLYFVRSYHTEAAALQSADFEARKAMRCDGSTFMVAVNDGQYTVSNDMRLERKQTPSD